MRFLNSAEKLFKEVAAPIRRTEFSGQNKLGRTENVGCTREESGVSFSTGRKPNGLCYRTTDGYDIIRKQIDDILDPKEIEQKFDLHDVKLKSVERDLHRLKRGGMVTAGAVLSTLPPHILGAHFLSIGFDLGEYAI